MTNPPCKDCAFHKELTEEDYTPCRNTCETYKQFEADYEAIRKARHRAEIEEYITERAIRQKWKPQ